MQRFRKKPVVIEAAQFTMDNADELIAWSEDVLASTYPTVLKISTLEGVMEAHVGDWIIKGVAGEFYPCRPDIFEATYERVD